MKLKLLIAGMFVAMAIVVMVIWAVVAHRVEPKRSVAFGGWNSHHTCVCPDSIAGGKR